MGALLRTVFVALLALALGVVATLWFFQKPRPKLPESPVVVEKIREVARLETLNITTYKIIPFSPDPESSGSLVKDFFLAQKFALFPTEGRAIVFADVHVGLDLQKLTPQTVQVRGDRAEVMLPPLVSWVELRPGDTQVIESNLDSQQTMQLLELAKKVFESEVARNPELRERAREANERAIRGLLMTLGYREVVFTPVKPGTANPG